MPPVFPPQAPILAPIQGTNETFPIRRIFCVGRNYLAHTAEMGIAIDKQQESPMYFLKDASCYVPSGSVTPYPPMTSNLHHELELVLAIGEPGFCIAPEQAWKHVYGYAVGLDMTRRDLQLRSRDKGHPWDTGKNYEQSAILSPIVRREEIGELVAGKIELKVNGQVRQSANLSQLIWSIPEILADLSCYYHLRAGDLIYTGTPEGVGPVVPGDILIGQIDKVGEIRLDIGPADDRFRCA